MLYFPLSCAEKRKAFEGKVPKARRSRPQDRLKFLVAPLSARASSYHPVPRIRGALAAVEWNIVCSTVHVGLRLFRSAQSRSTPTPSHSPKISRPALILLQYSLGKSSRLENHHLSA